MNRAQESLEGSQQPQTTSSGQSPPVQVATQEPVETKPEAAESTEGQKKEEITQLPPDINSESLSGCEAWNTKESFETVTEEAVTGYLEAGADLTARTKGGETPPAWAASANKNPQVLKALLAAEVMKKQKLSQNKMAALLKTSRTQVNRLLDPEHDVTLSSLQRAAASFGRRVTIELVQDRCQEHMG